MNRRKCLQIVGIGAAACALKTGRAHASDKVMLKSKLAEKVAWSVREIGSAPGSENLVIVTNAGWGELDSKPTAMLLDELAEVTECTRGKQNLLNPQTPYSEEPWVAVYDKQLKRMAFLRPNGNEVSHEIFNVDPKALFTPQGWLKVQKGLPGPRAFSAVSIALVWGQNPAWKFLRAAELHNHICPGLNAGYLMCEHVIRTLPLGKGQCYTIFGAPPYCANDAFQSIFDATTGKKGTFSAMVDPKAAARKYGPEVAGTQIVMRRNAQDGSFDGELLATDFDGILSACDLTSAQLHPEKGSADPMHFISRIKMAYELAGMPLEKRLGYIRVTRRIKGDAATYKHVISAGADPFAPLLDAS